MSPICRLIACSTLLLTGIGAQAALEVVTQTDRPELRKSLEELPLSLGDWSGRDVPIDPSIRERAQTDDCLNRVYESSRNPGVQFGLWINYSSRGLNMRHSPEVCLPSTGWVKAESLCKVMTVDRRAGPPVKLSRLVYSQGELVQSIGFWYYIFGEGRLERLVRQLPITSRSSHGRTTRGSGMTVEVFCSGELDPDGEVLRGFVDALMVELDRFLPEERAEYHVP
ncbi:EpsI family protein [Isosphaeraceae bacterium EP7]